MSHPASVASKSHSILLSNDWILNGYCGRLEIEGTASVWLRDQKVRLRHVNTNGYLHSHDKKYNRIVTGHQEVCGVTKKSSDNIWSAAEGVYFPAKSAAWWSLSSWRLPFLLASIQDFTNCRNNHPHLGLEMGTVIISHLWREIMVLCRVCSIACLLSFALGCCLKPVQVHVTNWA